MGFRPLSALHSHLSLLYLGSNALTYLEATTSTWFLDLTTSHEGTIYLCRSSRRAIHLTAPESVSHRSLGDLDLCSLVRCLVSPPRHHVPSRSPPSQTPCNSKYHKKINFYIGLELSTKLASKVQLLQGLFSLHTHKSSLEY